jgi:hypothetical protein
LAAAKHIFSFSGYGGMPITQMPFKGIEGIAGFGGSRFHIICIVLYVFSQ